MKLESLAAQKNSLMSSSSIISTLASLFAIFCYRIRRVSYKLNHVFVFGVNCVASQFWVCESCDELRASGYSCDKDLLFSVS
jgi:hypothetical protein